VHQVGFIYKTPYFYCSNYIQFIEERIKLIIVSCPCSYLHLIKKGDSGLFVGKRVTKTRDVIKLTNGNWLKYTNNEQMNCCILRIVKHEVRNRMCPPVKAQMLHHTLR
jgi:hypothetical protein